MSEAQGEVRCVVIGMAVKVDDPESLRAYARSRYAACWFDPDWQPADLAEAVLEALVLSNENPSPADYGIEIIDAEATEVSLAEAAAMGTAARGVVAGRTRKGSG